LKQQQKHTLGKLERLKSRKLIDLLFKNGKSFNLFPFRVIYMLNYLDVVTENELLKAGFSVSKRNFKKAVHRNRIKRLMRENYRLQKMELKNMLHKEHNNLAVFILYNGKELPEYDFVNEKMQLIINKLYKIANEKNIANI